MDSTFMGTMAGLALRLKELGQGHLRVVHCGERSRQLLSGLGLDQLFQISSNGARAPECGALASKPWRKKEQAKEMLAAHEALCEAAPENLLRFQRRSRLPQARSSRQPGKEVSWPPTSCGRLFSTRSWLSRFAVGFFTTFRQRTQGPRPRALEGGNPGRRRKRSSSIFYTGWVKLFGKRSSLMTCIG